MSDELHIAIKKAGSIAALAKACGYRWPSTVSNWLARGIPPGECAKVERATGVLCERLRPDIQWQRDPATGEVTGYVVPVGPVADINDAELPGKPAPDANASEAA